MNHDIFLKGKRVSLRPLRESDIPLLLKWMNDPEVRQYIKRYLPVTETEEQEWIRELSKQKDNIVLGIMTRDEKLIGTIGIHRINWKDRRATTGTVIGEKRFRNKGYGSEAKMLLLDYAFNTLNLHKICSNAYDFNKASQAYSKKCGYKVEAILKEHAFCNGRYVDQVVLAVFREDWLPLWKKFQRTGRL